MKHRIMNSEKQFLMHLRKSNMSAFNNQKSYNDSLYGFIQELNETIQELEYDLQKRNLSDFYIKLNSIKYLVVYSDILNQYWYMLRAYSGALKRILEIPTLDNAHNVFLYYYKKYGARRILKDENWFEKKRWAFLDQLIDTEDEESLTIFIKTYFEELEKCLIIYNNELKDFSERVFRLQ